MEYAVPREAGLEALREARDLIERRGWTISFPVEVRVAAADDVPLSTASGRDTMYLAFHVNARTDHTAYFTEVEALLRSYDGRPHWGKLHTRTAADLAPAYPRWRELTDLRAGSTRTGSSPTPTCARSSGTDQARRAHTLAGPVGTGARQLRHSAITRHPKQSSTPGTVTTAIGQSARWASTAHNAPASAGVA